MSSVTRLQGNVGHSCLIPEPVKVPLLKTDQVNPGEALRSLLKQADAAENVSRRGGSNFQFGRVRDFEWTTVELPILDLSKAHEGLRILHVTDLHVRTRWEPAFDKLIEQTARDVPGLILYTGDFVDNRLDHRRALPHVRKLVTSLPSRFGAFAVIGNHDGDLLAPRLREWGVRRLAGEAIEININGSPLEVVGLPGPLRIDCDERVIRSIPAQRQGVPRIMLSHYPDLLRFSLGLKPDIYLAGHTHGGQVCLPGRIPIIKHDMLPRKLCSGIHRVGDTWLVVGRGLGFATLPIRVFCPAEVIEIRLRLQTS